MGKKWKTIEPGIWKPENEGDSIEGILINKEPRDEAKDISAKFYIENENGMHMVWGSAILEDRMQYVKVGQEVKITFNGTTKNKKNQKVNLFEIAVAEPEEETETDNEPASDIPAEQAATEETKTPEQQPRQTTETASADNEPSVEEEEVKD